MKTQRNSMFKAFTGPARRRILILDFNKTESSEQLESFLTCEPCITTGESAVHRDRPTEKARRL